MARSFSSDEDTLQHDSDTGESQISGSTPNESDVEDEAPQEEEEENPQEESKKTPHLHNTRNSRGRATTEATKPKSNRTSAPSAPAREPLREPCAQKFAHPRQMAPRAMTENIEEFLILDSLSLSQLSSCERARSTFSSSKHGE
jgi:hypothetical protein